MNERRSFSADEARNLLRRAGIFGLQLGSKLKRMCRYYPVIVIRCGYHSRRISHTRFYIVYRRLAQQIIKHFFALLAGTIVIRPARTSGKGVIAQHVQYAYGWQRHFYQFRPLCHDCAYQ